MKGMRRYAYSLIREGFYNLMRGKKMDIKEVDTKALKDYMQSKERDTYERQHAIEKALLNKHNISIEVWKQRVSCLGTSLDLYPHTIEDGLFVVSLLEAQGLEPCVYGDRIVIYETDFVLFKYLLSTLAYGNTKLPMMMQNQAY